MPGDKIQVTGRGFSVGTIRVYFWNGVFANTTVTSDTMLTATVPAGAATGALGIQRNAGSIIYTAEYFTVIGAGPYITHILPSFGSSNTLVEIFGVHLTNVAPTGVKFNGVASRDASPNAAGTMISVRVPYGTPAGTGPINVTTRFGSSNSPSPFTVIGPGPYITGFEPDHGTPGTKVWIHGVQFATATNATFNGIRGANFYATDTLIQVDAPANVTTGPIAVNSPFGSYTNSRYFYVPPSLTSLSPASGRPNTNVTIMGTNFLGATTVRFGTTAAAFTVVNNNQIQTLVPTGAVSGTLQIIISTNFSCSTNFTVLPTIYSFSPGFGREGTNVTITGANFNVGTPVIRFNGVQATQVSGVTFGQLTAVVPPGTTSGPISITTSDGSHTSVTNFLLPPTVTGFAPANGLSGSQITVSGVNFLGATNVSFNGAAAVFTVSNNTTLVATVPAEVSTGPITVITPAGSATSSGLFYGSPLITSFAPVTGAPGTNVTITGTNFLGTTAVRFNGLGAAFTVTNNGQILAVAPAGVQTGPITVVTPAGTNTSTNSFVAEYPSNLEVWITDSPDPVTATSNLTYAVTVVNRGPFEAPVVRLTNTLPTSVRLVSVTMPLPWTVVTNANQVIASIDHVAVGGTSTLFVNVLPQVPGDIVAGAVVSSDHTDPIPGNNSVAITTTVDPLAVLSIAWWTNQVKVSWHIGLSQFVLESKAGSLNAGSWSIVTNAPIISGSQKYVIDTTAAPQKYYRLKR